MRPPPSVLEAFAVTGEPRLLSGGMGRTWLAGDVVVKPVDNPVEHAWVCEVYAAWPACEVGVPEPLAVDGRWSVDGWSAHAYLPGSSARAGDDPDWFRHACDAFHAVVSTLPRPDFLDARDDAWSYGDRVAWEGAVPEGFHETQALLDRALAHLAEVDLPSQVIHGDLGGNVLRDGDRAAVIDWPPYYRPRAWALAVVATDAVCWEGAAPHLLDRWGDDPVWPQLLLRAVVYRLATRGHNEVRGAHPVGSDGYVADEARILRLVEERV
jgi:uncharacterized protein (TIGR02569 family)